MTTVQLGVEYRRFFDWVLRVLRQFFRVRPRTTLLVLAALTLSDIMRLTATVLPLKVILLAGSSGVPRGLSFITPDSKAVWIGLLTVGAFAAYGLTLALEALADQQGRLAGADILHGANLLTLHAEQEVEAKRAFIALTRLIAAVLVVLVAAPVLLWLSPLTLVFLLIALVGWLSLPVWAFSSPSPVARWLRAWLSENYRQFLPIAATLSFLGVFLTILAPFVLGYGGNIALLVLVNMTVRQVLNNLTAIVRTSIGLWPDQQRIEALFFPHAYAAREPRGRRDGFAQTGDLRPQLLAGCRTALALPDGSPAGLALSWQDTALKGIRIYRLAVTADVEQPARHYQLQVYSANRQDQLANEEVLFRHVTRQQLATVAVVGRFRSADLQCRICDVGAAAEVPTSRWRTVQEQLLQRVLAVVPDAELLQSYRLSRPLLPDRLEESLFRRLTVLLDNPADEALLADWLAGLPQLQQQLREQPLALYNPDLNRATVVSVDGDWQMLSWGRWQLEPFGAVLQLFGQSRRAERYLAALREQRPDLAQRTWHGDLALGALCQQLELEIEREQLRAALATIGELMKLRGQMAATAEESRSGS